eukprot:Awhi_evm1s11366
MTEEKECMICFGPGRLKMNNVFQLPLSSKDTKNCCKHTYCAPCMEEYLATMPNRFSCAFDGCRASCDTVYAIKWLKGRNKKLCEDMSIEIANQVQKNDILDKAYFGFDDSLTTFLKSSGARQCPGCKHLVERASGCDQMTCKCATLFCYCCGYIPGSKEYIAYHTMQPLIYENSCGTCQSSHEEVECPITTCFFCGKIGHSLKDCLGKDKVCLDCGYHVDHLRQSCSKVLLKKLKKESDFKVERIKYLGDYIPHNTTINVADEEEIHDDDDYSNYSNYARFDPNLAQPVSLLDFVVSR